ncbi:hypothetical protein M271_49305 [Streptomyces rapamycinicus NRRL 5491]|uniref:Luciferase-like domain-containing protein n=2 Tax=Streptomyces rapamycinicus TaxID=1226757 RepID=A0A0A0NW35_STRRN|nr:hypothetical protein M271_49305 [Streptomyces rapamycinicus NRRL 5491]RLV71940.1 hypothetical protein D3C57_145475 [Streptomyces rapamycinicus NRRL 5491]
MKLWCHVTNTPMNQLLEFARVLDDLGFDGVALAHHLVDLEAAGAEHPYRRDDEDKWWDSSGASDPATPDPWVTATAIANVTNNIVIASSIFVLPLQDPFSVAKAVSTAAHFSRGRLVMGFGVGWMRDEYELVGADFKTRGARMNEMLEVIRLLLTGDAVDYDGDFFKFSGVRMAPPYDTDVPMYLGGESPRALRRAARYDGWFGAGPYDAPTAIERCAAMRAARAEADTLDRPFECIVPLMDVPTKGEWEGMAEVGATGAMFVPARRSDLRLRTIGDRRAYAEAIVSRAQECR